MGLLPLAGFFQPRRAIPFRYPNPAAFPARIGIIDAALESLGIEAKWIRDSQRDELAVH